ncbi:MAG: helix-turn-helix domain-containing protein [Armatimonadota bacterium]
MPFNKDWQKYVSKLLDPYPQMEAARLVRVSQSTISNWRKGQLPTDSEMVYRLAKATEQDPEELQEMVRRWTVCTALQADYDLTDRELLEVQGVLDRVIERRRKTKRK